MTTVTKRAEKRTTRVRGLAPWQPHAATRALLGTVHGILEEYAAYLPMTLRQVFYRLVGAHSYPKSEQGYARLGEHLNRARRAGLIGFNVIRDDDAEISTTIGLRDEQGLIDAWQADVRGFRLDRQRGQPQRHLIMVEARGMKPQIETIARDYGVPVNGSGGFDSLTAKYRLASQLGRNAGLTEVLHIGDHDPSGEHLFLSLADDVNALIRDRSLPGKVQFTRLAVTPAQIDTLRLPTSPRKDTDRRSFDGDTVQAEAIPPDVLAGIVRSALESRIDPSALNDVLAHEASKRARLLLMLDRLLGGKSGDGDDHGDDAP